MFEYLAIAIETIDGEFGVGYAKQHPELVAALTQAAALDRVARAIAEHTNASRRPSFVETAAAMNAADHDDDDDYIPR